MNPLCFYISSPWATQLPAAARVCPIFVAIFTLVLIFTLFSTVFRGFKVGRNSACINITNLIRIESLPTPFEVRPFCKEDPTPRSAVVGAFIQLSPAATSAAALKGPNSKRIGLHGFEY